MTAARRPLWLGELREAISIEPGDITWNAAKLVNDVMKSLDCCGSLVVVDDEFSTVHLAHSSVRQHLEASPDILDVSEYHIKPDTADKVLGDIVVTYLNLDILQKQVTRYSKTSTALSPDYTSTVLRANLPLPAVSSSSLARRFLKNRKTPQFDVRRELEKAAGFTRESKMQPSSIGSFFSYAQEHWISHTRSFENSNITGTDIYTLWERMLEGEVPTVNLPWSSQGIRHLSKDFLDFVAQSSNITLLMYAIRESRKMSPDDPLQARRFLKRVRSQNSAIYKTCYSSYEAVGIAVLSNNTAVVRLVCDRMDVKFHGAEDPIYLALLELALDNQNLDIFKILLDRTADFLDIFDMEYHLFDMADRSSLYEQAFSLLLARGIGTGWVLDDKRDASARKRWGKANFNYHKKKQEEDEGTNL